MLAGHIDRLVRYADQPRDRRGVDDCTEALFQHLRDLVLHTEPQNLAQEALGSFPVSVACDQDIEDITILVHRSPKIMAFAADRNEQLVHVPYVTEATLSPPQSPSVLRSKLRHQNRIAS